MRVQRIDSSLPLPAYATEGAAGFDFVSRLSVTVNPGDLALIPTNSIIEVPEAHVLLVMLRSSTPRTKGLLCPNGVGVIDRDYCGPEDEIQVQVLNFTRAPITVERGERVAQGIIVSAAACTWRESGPLRSGSRGGFGTTR